MSCKFFILNIKKVFLNIKIFCKLCGKGGVIKYETDRGGRDLKILIKNLEAQHKQQKEFPGPTVSSKKIS